MSGPGDDAALVNLIQTLRLPLEELPGQLELAPLPGPFDVSITPPGSKSLTNRALLLAGLAEGESLLKRPLVEADDAQRMIEALQRMGARIEVIEPGAKEHPEGALHIRGVGGRPRGDIELFLGNAGTALRFLCAAALLADGPVTLDGSARMRERPIGELGLALRGLGASVEYLGAQGYPPLRVTPPEHVRRARIMMPTTASSQFISALLLVAPWLDHGLTLELSGEVTSGPYVVMTLELLSQLGAVGVHAKRDLSFAQVEHGELSAFEYQVEPDASGATYFWTAAALTAGSRCVVPGLGSATLQGDAHFTKALIAMGAAGDASEKMIEVRAPRGSDGASRELRGITVALSGMPDTAMTLAAACCFASGPSEIRGLRTLRVKETDRLEALRIELSKIGVSAEIFAGADQDEGLRLTPPAGGLDCSLDATPVCFETYEDHRMAMALALIGLRRPNVEIRDPQCVAKTYPTFWSDLATVYESSMRRQAGS